MDRRIEDHLEEYLRGTLGPRDKAEFERALAEADPEMQSLIQQMTSQSDWIREAFRVPEIMDPAPGFYARVMDRVEQQSTGSIWSAFVDPRFFWRLAFASATMLLLLTFAIATSGLPEPVVAETVVLQPDVELAREPAPILDVTSVSNGSRERVLVDLATFEQ
jgi:anti-sigma factor RsiW